MANVSYPQYNLKTITLPLDYTFITDHDGEHFITLANAYKEKYGIDLIDLITFEKPNERGYIRLDVDGLVLIRNDSNKGDYPDLPHNFINVYWLSGNDADYISGSSDAILTISCGTIGVSWFGLSIIISKDETFSIENAIVNISEA